MRAWLFTIIASLTLSGCHLSAAKQQRSEPPRAIVNGRTFTWAERGLTVTLPNGWRRDDDGDNQDSRAWTTADSSKFVVNVALYDPKFGNRSIEDETESFYQDQLKNGDQDVRYLEIDGVRGVHHRRDNEGYDALSHPQNEKLIQWHGQRIYQGQRQVIHVVLSTPAPNFAANSDTLYALLESIKFPANIDASSVATSDNDVMTIVSIPKDGDFYLGKRRIARSEVIPEIDKILRDRPPAKQIFYIKAADDVSYATIAALHAEAGKAGYEKIGLVASKAGQSNSDKKSVMKSVGKEKSAEPETNGGDGVLTVKLQMSNGTPQITIGDSRTPVPLTRVAQQVHDALAGKQFKGVILLAQGTTSYKWIVEVIDQLKAGGADSVGLGPLSP